MINRRPISAAEEDLLLEFAEYLATLVGPASVAAYQGDLRLFAESSPTPDWLQSAPAQQDAYFDALHARGLKRDTISRKATALRHFYVFLAKTAGRNRSLLVTSDPTPGARNQMAPRALRALAVSTKAVDRELCAFLAALQANRAQATVRAYTADLLALRRAWPQLARWHDVTERQLADFIAREATTLQPNSAARRLAAVQSFFRWLEGAGHAQNVGVGLRLPRASKTASLPAASALASMAAPARRASFAARRDAAIFELLYRCGLGVAEIAALDRASLNLTRSWIKVLGRRARYRTVDLEESTLATLRGYMSASREVRRDDCSALIINARGGRLTPRSIGRLIKQMARARQLPEDVHPHVLRQAFAWSQRQGGRSVHEIRHNLGVTGQFAVQRITRGARSKTNAHA